MCNCNCRFNCTLAAIISAVIVGVIAAFLQITGTITVGIPFLWVALGIGVVYLAGLLWASVLHRRSENPSCLCRALNALLSGALGTVLFALVLLAVGIVATSILSAILVGLLVFFLWLTVSASACYVRCTTDCE